MIAIALSADPKLLLCDEPTTALDVTDPGSDPQTARGAAGQLGVALVFVTHDLAVVAQTCHRVAVMYAGQIVETGTVDAVFREPHHPYTLGLLRRRRPTSTRPSGQLRRSRAAHRTSSSRRRVADSHPRCGFVRQDCRVAPIPLTRLATDARRAASTTRSAPPTRAGSRWSPVREPLLSVQGLECTSRCAAGTSRAGCGGTHPTVLRAVDGVDLELFSRRDARPRRRVGLRQVDARPLRRRAVRADRGRDPLRRPAARQRPGPRRPASDPDGLPGSVRVAQPADDGAAGARRAAAGAPHRPSRPGRRALSRAARPRRPLGARARRPPRPVLRRPAPAAWRSRVHSRSSPRYSSPTSRSRRSTCPCRRRPEPARGASRAAWPDGAPDRPQPRRRPPRLRPGRGDVPRADRGDRRDERAPRQPPPPLHPRPRPGRPAARCRAALPRRRESSATRPARSTSRPAAGSIPRCALAQPPLCSTEDPPLAAGPAAASHLAACHFAWGAQPAPHTPEILQESR